MSLVSTVNISYQELVVEDPEEYPQTPRFIGPNSDQFRIPCLQISPTAGEKKEVQKNSKKKNYQEDLLPPSSFHREEGEESWKEEEKFHGSLLLVWRSPLTTFPGVDVHSIFDL